MSLTAGTRLGPYEILAPLGKGGMGEVYRARDTKLDRDVAIKVLPDSLAQDHDRLARFEREAKVLASLNHPNIAQIYGLEENALVMELVAGSTLSVPQPIETALIYARQIAEALEAAHEKGITHRDLKPGNIMVTPEGVVKVLDFGLATVPSREGADGVKENSPTMTMTATQAGMIMGTAAYMSPEQAAGKAVDKRSDIWSFGVVLWEMITGAKLFDGETISHTLASVLKDPIDFGKIPPRTPGPVTELLRRCLDRDLKTRLRDIGEARIAIAKYLADPGGGTPIAARGTSKWGWVVAAALAVALIGVSVAYRNATRPTAPKPLVRLDVDLGADVSLSPMFGPTAILSPDSTRLVYVSKDKLVTRKLDQPKATELAGTEGAVGPFFSPDGQWLAFFAHGKLQKISVEGGAPRVLCDAPDGRGGSWGADGTIVAALDTRAGLSRIPVAGGGPEPLTQLAPGEYSHRWPQSLPGSKAVVFTSAKLASAWDEANIEVVSLPDRHRKILRQGGSFGRYIPSSSGKGHLMYVINGTLFALAFDPDALEVRGTPVQVLDHVAYSPTYGSAQFDFSVGTSGPGTPLYRSGGVVGSEMVTVQWLDGTGRTQPLLTKPGRYQSPRLSPDGQRLALSVAEGSSRDIWIYEWQRDTMTRLTFGAGGSYPNPVWSPDGRYIVFSGRGGSFSIRSDGADKPGALTQSGNRQVPSSFAPDGKRLAWSEFASGGFDLWTLPLESDAAGLRGGKPEVFLQTGFEEREPAFSPDGRWIAYDSNESGTFQVYVRAFPDKGGKWQISNGGGAQPVWSPRGRELFFESFENRIMVAAWSVKGDSFVPDNPRAWPEKRMAAMGAVGNGNYDVAPDGKRIAALIPVETPEAEPAQRQMIFLLNFADELRRKAPLNGK